MDSVFGSQVIYAAVTAWFIQRLKGSSWFPFITQGTENLNKFLAALFAALGTVGILVAHVWEPASHTLTISIAGLTVMNVAHFVWNFLGQYVLTTGAYHLAVKPMDAAKKNGTLPPAPGA